MSWNHAAHGRSCRALDARHRWAHPGAGRGRDGIVKRVFAGSPRPPLPGLVELTMSRD